MVVQHLASAQQAERSVALPATVTVSLPPGTTTTRTREALATLVARHELLRGRLAAAHDGSGRTVQEVSGEATLAWRPSEDPDWSLEAGLTDMPLRVQVLDGDPVRARVTLPCAQVDTGALLVVARELTALTAGRVLDEPVQNSQYATWQAELDAAPAHVTVDVLPSPQVMPAGPLAVSDEPLRRQVSELTGAQWTAVQAGATALGVDVDALLLTAWLIGQARRRSADHTAVYVDHRAIYDDLVDTVGVTSRYLPFALGVDEDDVVRDVAQRVGSGVERLRATFDSFQWRSVPPRTHASDSRSPQQPVLFSSHPVPEELLRATPEVLEPSHLAQVSVQVVHGPSGARIDLLHRPSLVPPGAADALLDTLVTVATSLGSHADTRVAALPLLTAQAQQRLLSDVGRSPEDLVPPTGTPFQWIADQADRTPDRLAVIDAERSWTYADLLARAGAISGAIAGSGAPPGAPIALLVERSADMVAAVLGVWRAGAPYVPVDPATPPERLAFILADSGAALLVTDLDDGTLPSGGDVPVLHLMDLGAVAPVLGLQDAEQLAYVIYTSGTTGRPKGVMVEHRSLLNLAMAHRVRIYRHHDDTGGGLRATLNAPLAFDGAAERIMLLATGHTLYVVDDETRRDPEAFVGFVRRHRLEVLDGTPAFVNELLRAGLLDASEHRPRAVLVGGEAIGSALWHQLAEITVAFYNVYGPTEATINAAVGRVVGPSPHLGAALPNVRLYVLDEARRPVPVGVPGEIHVSGAGVSRGYLNRPELTERVFVDNPLAAGEPTYDRLYATGDLGRLRADGSIDFLGRADGQIKLRGYRIETGELESLITEDPAVEAALVRLTGDSPERHHLVAHVVAPASAHEGLAERLLARMRQQVPAYMVPSHLVAVAAWPLTLNGKIDVTALPSPESVDAPSAMAFVTPSGPLETTVARVWAEVLQRDRVSADDNFFEVGGHSLLVPVLLRRLSEEVGVPLPMRTIFTARTVTAMAKEISLTPCRQLDPGPLGPEVTR